LLVKINERSMVGQKWAICRIFSGGAKFNFRSARKYTKYFPLTVGLLSVCFGLHSSFILEDAKGNYMQQFFVEPDPDWEFKRGASPSFPSLCSRKSLDFPSSWTPGGDTESKWWKDQGKWWRTNSFPILRASRITCHVTWGRFGRLLVNISWFGFKMVHFTR